MREPSTQTRILASAPVYLTSWAVTVFFGYHFWRGEPVFWALVVVICFLLKVIQADEQVRAYKAWKREWDAMAGIPTRPTRWPRIVGLALVGLPLGFLFYDVGQHGGASAILGVALLFIIPLVAIGLALKLIRGMMRRKAVKVVPVTICVKRSLAPAPTIKRAYRGLPVHCRAILRTHP